MQMFNVIKKLLLSRQISFEEGEIKLLGQSITMLPVELYVAMFNELKKSQPASYREIIYNIAKNVGKIYTKKLHEKYALEDSHKIAEWDVNTLALAGLGKAEVLKYDLKNKNAELKVMNSPIAKALKPQKEVVDFIIAGFIAGSSIIAFSSEKMVCEELTCLAKGDQFCLFKVYESK